MNQKKGTTVKDCPLNWDVCYPSCFFWKERCCHVEIMDEYKKNRGIVQEERK